jgi:DNA repair protein RecN (Recombination protein N)
LIGLRDNLEKEVLNVEDIQNSILQLEEEVDVLENELTESAEKLHAQRLEAVGDVSQTITSILDELKLPNTKLEFKLTKREAFNQFGLTDVAMMFSANLGIEAVPIEKAASGGELSRVMLALQKLISEKSQFPTVLFDEIDTGVSGDVAQKIGSLLNKMGQHFQLIAISHLPQVAAKADQHFRVEKELIDGRTTTCVQPLNNDQRVEEIARLMSGEQITEAAIETARALMN